jgi:glycogen synthase
MKILMFGWEFPPYNQGGLGTACEGIVRGLINGGAQVTMVLPRQQETNIKGCKIVSPNLALFPIDSSLQAYHSSSTYPKDQGHLYGANLLSEVERFAKASAEMLRHTGEKFDIIHAHDWLAYPAGINAKKLLEIPLIVHVHATEYDRTGGLGANQEVFLIEKYGMKQADKVITVSNFTKHRAVQQYGIPEKKIAVVHNGVEIPTATSTYKQHHQPLVLFLGRITLQKGPDYFLQAAKKIISYNDKITFAYAGNGDMQARLMEEVARDGLGDKILFTGFLRGQEVDRMFQQAAVYVMPSVSEPFGISPLEAMRNGVPTIISKQSGVSEVTSHCLKVDFWDINEMANKILATIENRPLAHCLSRNGHQEVQSLTWNKAATECLQVYQQVLEGAS